jgi:hypothetical protein
MKAAEIIITTVASTPEGGRSLLLMADHPERWLFL